MAARYLCYALVEICYSYIRLKLCKTLTEPREPYNYTSKVRPEDYTESSGDTYEPALYVKLASEFLGVFMLLGPDGYELVAVFFRRFLEGI